LEHISTITIEERGAGSLINENLARPSSDMFTICDQIQ
jgi:hypothetical protein